MTNMINTCINLRSLIGATATELRLLDINTRLSAMAEREFVKAIGAELQALRRLGENGKEVCADGFEASDLAEFAQGPTHDNPLAPSKARQKDTIRAVLNIGAGMSVEGHWSMSLPDEAVTDLDVLMEALPVALKAMAEKARRNADKEKQLATRLEDALAVLNRK